MGTNCVPFAADLFLFCNSRGTNAGKKLTRAPERYTAEFCMDAKVTLWCI